jgi:hypothetical protein
MIQHIVRLLHDLQIYCDESSCRSGVYLGINDCGGRGDDILDIITTKLFDTLRDLYVKAKARNFVLIGVPPFQHTPMSMTILIFAFFLILKFFQYRGWDGVNESQRT